MKPMRKHDFLALLRRRVQDAGSQSALAKELGISDSYLSDVLTQRREPGEAMLTPMGIERVVVYREAEK